MSKFNLEAAKRGDAVQVHSHVGWADSHFTGVSKDGLRFYFEQSTELSDEDERNAFELWYSSTHDAVDLSKRDDGLYENWDIDLHWSAWKARALLSRKQGSKE